MITEAQFEFWGQLAFAFALGANFVVLIWTIKVTLDDYRAERRAKVIMSKMHQHVRQEMNSIATRHKV